MQLGAFSISLAANDLTEADERTTGPGRFIVIDPDGNSILVDQHR